MGFNIVDCKGIARPKHPRHTWLLLNLPQKSEIEISTKNAMMLSKSSPHAITFAAARWKNLLYPDLLHNLSIKYHLQWPVQAHVNELIRYKYKIENRKIILNARTRTCLVEADVANDKAHLGAILRGNVPGTTSTRVFCVLGKHKFLNLSFWSL